jgi:nicotinamide mononucleotide transporter
MSIYGWYMWSKVVDNKDHHIRITRTNFSDKLKAFGIFLFTSVFVVVVYRYYDVMPNDLGFSGSYNYFIENASSGNVEQIRLVTPYLDTLTTGVFFAAMWLMANKKLENWTLWIIGDIVSIPLYFIKGYGFTGLQYSIFLILAIMGYFEWRKQLIAKN